MSLPGSNDQERLEALREKTYSEQACWFLNAFWEDFASEEAENVWKQANLMSELCEDKGKNGSVLSEFFAHRFLELQEETLTVREMRTQLRAIDVDAYKQVSLVEYLIIKYKIDWHVLVNSAQGNKEEVKIAQEKLEAAQAALAKARAEREEARQAEAAAKRAEKEAKKAEEEARKAEEQAKKI